MATILVGAAIAPTLILIQKQVQATRWSTERLLAVQLANQVLETYTAQGGYTWITARLTPPPPPPVTLRFDTTMGSSPVGVPAALNPVLGGPLAPGDPGNAVNFGSPQDVVTRQTLENIYRFRRRVEILGGADYNPFPGVTGFPGTAPFPLQVVDCYLVRITISTDLTGTMNQPGDMYQVVTIFAP